MTVHRPALAGPPPPPTGNRAPGETDATAVARATVERAMAGLEGLADRPLAEHVEAFERVHAALGEALTERNVAPASSDAAGSA